MKIAIFSDDDGASPERGRGAMFGEGSRETPRDGVSPEHGQTEDRGNDEMTTGGKEYHQSTDGPEGGDRRGKLPEERHEEKDSLPRLLQNPEDPREGP